jgi:hypothetical protein
MQYFQHHDLHAPFNELEKCVLASYQIDMFVERMVGTLSRNKELGSLNRNALANSLVALVRLGKILSVEVNSVDEILSVIKKLKAPWGSPDFEILLKDRAFMRNSLHELLNLLSKYSNFDELQPNCKIYSTSEDSILPELKEALVQCGARTICVIPVQSETQFGIYIIGSASKDIFMDRIGKYTEICIPEIEYDQSYEAGCKQD